MGYFKNIDTNSQEDEFEARRLHAGHNAKLVEKGLPKLSFTEWKRKVAHLDAVIAELEVEHERSRTRAVDRSYEGFYS